MSIYPNPNELDAFPSKFELVILAAKRARQLKDGAPQLIVTSSTNPLTIALEEIAQGAVRSRRVEDATAIAHEKSLKPAEPSLEDIIGAGSVLGLDIELDTAAAQAAALRSADPDNLDDVDDASGSSLRIEEALGLGEPDGSDEEEEDDEFLSDLNEETE